MMLVVLVSLLYIVNVSAKFSFLNKQKPVVATLPTTLTSSSSAIPSSGIIDYIGSTTTSNGDARWSTPLPTYEGIIIINHMIIIIITIYHIIITINHIIIIVIIIIN